MSNRTHTYNFEGTIVDVIKELCRGQKYGIQWELSKPFSSSQGWLSHLFRLDTKCIEELFFVEKPSKAKVRLQSRTKPSLFVEYEQDITFTSKQRTFYFEFLPSDNDRHIPVKDWYSLDTVKFELSVSLNVGASNILPPWDVEDPAVYHDRVLIIEDKRIHVVSDILSASSTYFRNLFDSDPQKREFSIDNVTSPEFIKMLSCIYPNANEIDGYTASLTRPVAERFEIPLLLARIDSLVSGDQAPPPSHITVSPNFEDPQTSYDRILIVEGRRIYVLSGILSAWSYFFRTMFTSDFMEKEMKEIVLDELSADEFIELLRVIYPGRNHLNADSAPFTLSLADRFDMPALLSKCSRFLCEAPPLSFTLREMLDMVFTYRLADVKNKCIEIAKRGKLDYFKPPVVGEICQVSEAEELVWKISRR